MTLNALSNRFESGMHSTSQDIRLLSKTPISGKQSPQTQPKFKKPKKSFNLQDMVVIYADLGTKQQLRHENVAANIRQAHQRNLKQ